MENRKAKELKELLVGRGMTMATAESCTGGLIAHLMTGVSGVSACYKGTVVSYVNEVKTGVLGVEGEAIERETEVSGTVAEQMAEGVCRLMEADVAVSTTGYAGPTGGTPEQPVGTVWIGVCVMAGGEVVVVRARQHRFVGGRDAVIRQAAETAIESLLETVKELNGIEKRHERV